MPDGAGQLSEGLLVEASIVARLFRMRLLAIDASLIVVPAQVQGRTPPAPIAPRLVRAHAIGGGLAAAERLLDEGASSLAATRTTASRTRR